MGRSSELWAPQVQFQIVTENPLDDAALLVTLGRTSSISQAAHALGVSQQAASARLDRLEAGLGVRLADRGARGAQLSESGRSLLPAAGVLRSAAADWQRALSAAAVPRDPAGSRNALRIAASRTVADFLLPGWLARAGRMGAPVSGVTALPRNSRDVARLTADGACGLGFVESTRQVTHALAAPHGLSTATVAWDELVLVVPPDHAWAKAGAVTAAELAQTPLVLREPGSGTRDALEAALAPRRATAPVMTLESSVGIRSAVIAGAGPAVLSVLVVEHDLARGALVAVRIGGHRLRRPITALWRGDRDELGALERALLSVAR